MFLNFIRSKRNLTLMAAAVAAVATSANAAVITFTGGTATIVQDSGDRSTVAATTPIPVNTDVPLSGLYGTPTVTQPTGVIKFDFQQLSSQFRSTASSAVYSAAESVDTDGKLTINLTFDTPTSIGASIYEDGFYNTTNGGTTSVLGTGIEVEGDTAIPNPPSIGVFNTTMANGGWTASTNVTSNGSFSSYTITIDNDLFAQTTSGANGVSTADIYKKDFILVITPGGGSGRTPEPASIGLLSLGALGLLARRRK